MASETGKMGADFYRKRVLHDLMCARQFHQRGSVTEELLSGAERDIRDHWRPNDDLRALYGQSNTAIVTAITQLTEGDAQAALNTLMLHRYGYALPDDFIWKAKDERTKPIETVVINGGDKPLPYKLAHDLLNAEQAILALKSRVEALEKCAPDAPKPTMPSAEEQK